MLLPVLPVWCHYQWGDQMTTTVALLMIFFGIGLFLFGGVSSYLVQRYRRNHVCLYASVGMMGSVAILFLTYLRLIPQLPIIVYGTGLLLGASYGLSQIVLSSTLIVDVSESSHRTEANHAAAWFRRFSISLGPALACLLYRLGGFQTVYIAIMVCQLVAVLLVMTVDFPFRAPDEELQMFSLDRFLLPQGFLLFFNLMLMTFSFGLILSRGFDILFYSLLMGGFLLAIFSERVVFADAELKSETVTGLICVGAALLLMITRDVPVVYFITPVLIGFGYGIIGSRFLLFFIKLSRHCQRGTSQSSFFLSWTLGITLGLGAGYLMAVEYADWIQPIALGIVVLCLLVYNVFTHPWYLKHKNR